MSSIDKFTEVLVTLSPETMASLAQTQSVPVTLDGFTEWELVALMACGHMHAVGGVICWTPESIAESNASWRMMPLKNVRPER